ncbi:MAG: SAM-dependent methyltransferase [Oscillospiraceae bacterium]|nr:SAM-dependent methyltransferase [Oscillospiraceae bacterium]
MVRVRGRIADVGTDHALLPCRLFQLGAKDIIATDIADGPLERARAAVQLYGAESAVRLVKCDGLDGVPVRDDVIIAGMGGEMTADIIARCKFLHPDLHFILQPMTRDFVLRKRLYELGCEIVREETAVVARKVYTVMLCRYTGVKQETDLRFRFLGKNSDREYLEKQITTLYKMGKSREDCKALAEQLTADIQ